ncbi:MAG: PIG-L family deacetylase, partial [Chloroflexota bacterium]|nr:PIG-L family deacetylase [Chloroflexota bacterium]
MKSTIADAPAPPPTDVLEVADTPAAAPGDVPLHQPHEARPERVMVIVAHPDDADFGPAATVAGWVRAGSVAELVCCTSGDAGGEDPRIDPLELARVREREQRAAAEIIGYQQVTFLHRPDGALQNDLALREQLVRLIRTFRPEAVLTMDPTVLIHDDGYVQHTDHRAAAMAALDAVYPAARNPMAFPHLAIDEGLDKHLVRWLYFFWTDKANAWVDTTSSLAARVAALRAHESQIEEPEKLEERVREWAREAGSLIGTDAAE